jgi:hypothetical protein
LVLLVPPIIKPMAIGEAMWKLGVLADAPDFKKSFKRFRQIA